MATSIDGLFRQGESWPPKEESERLKRYEGCNQLYDGEHVKAFAQSVHTIRGDVKASLEYVLNWPKAMTLAFADLLVGEPPMPYVPEGTDKQQAAAEDYWRRNDAGLRAYEAAIDMSRFGDAVLKGWLKDGKAGLQTVRPDVWFPVYEPGMAQKIAAHVLAWTEHEQESGIFGRVKEATVLMVEIHTPGRVEYRRYRVNAPKVAGAGMTIGEQLPVIGRPEAEEVPNGRCLVVSAPNVATSTSALGKDDYTDIESLVLGLANRFAQIDKILDKHAEPGMQGPKKHIKKDEAGEAYVDLGGGPYFGRDKDEPPVEYVTWEGQLSAAFAEIALFKSEFYALSETTAALFGEVPAGGAMSEAALRWLLMRPLAHVNRMRMNLDPALRYAVTTGLQLEGTPDLEDIAIKWQDGLPRDEAAAVDMANKRVTGGLWSKKAAIMYLDQLDEAEAEEMLEDIAEEKKAAMPFVPVPEARLNLSAKGTEMGAPSQATTEKDDDETKPVQ